MDRGCVDLRDVRADFLQLIVYVCVDLAQTIHVGIHVFVDQIDVADHVSLLLGDLLLELAQLVDGFLRSFDLNRQTEGTYQCGHLLLVVLERKFILVESAQNFFVVGL